MKSCVTNSNNLNRNVPLNNKSKTTKNRHNTNSANSLLTNAANMKITKAIVNSKQQQQQRKTATAPAKGSNTLHAKSTSFDGVSHLNRVEGLNMTEGQDLNLNARILKEDASHTKKESPAEKEMAYGREQRSATQPTNTHTHTHGLVAATTTTPTSATASNETTNSSMPLYAGVTNLREHNHDNNNYSGNQQALQSNNSSNNNNNGNSTACSEFLRSGTNLNLSSLATKPPQLISVVNERSNQTVLRTTTAPTTTTTTTTNPPNDDNDNNIIIKVSNNNNNNNNSQVTTNREDQQPIDSRQNYQEPVKKISTLNFNVKTSDNESVTTNGKLATTTTTNTSANNPNSNTTITTNSSDNTTSPNKTVINSVITTATTNHNNNNNNSAKESHLKSEQNNTSVELPATNHHHEENLTPQNYRGLNNSVIITNYHQSSHGIQNSEFNASTILNVVSNDPNLNLAVTGHNLQTTSDITAEHLQVAGGHSDEQQQQILHHHPQQQQQQHPQSLANCPPEHWLNAAYNSCAYDLSLNHPSSNCADLGLQLLPSPHHTPHGYYNPHPHHPHHLNSSSPLTPSYLQEEHNATMRSNLALYTTPYGSHHEHHLHQHGLMGSQTTGPTIHHTYDEIIQDTLKDECLEEHQTGASYLTLNPVDIQSLKDTYHSPGLGQEITPLTAIAPAHLQAPSPTTASQHHHLHAIHYIQHNNSASSGGNSPSPSSGLSQSGGDLATLQNFTQLTNASAGPTGHRDIYSMLSGPEQGQMFSFTSPPSPVLANG